jgi:hypothetical protein
MAGRRIAMVGTNRERVEELIAIPLRKAVARGRVSGHMHSPFSILLAKDYAKVIDQIQ